MTSEGVWTRTRDSLSQETDEVAPELETCDFCRGPLPEAIPWTQYVECPRCRTLYRIDWW